MALQDVMRQSNELKTVSIAIQWTHWFDNENQFKPRFERTNVFLPLQSLASYSEIVSFHCEIRLKGISWKTKEETNVDGVVQHRFLQHPLQDMKLFQLQDCSMSSNFPHRWLRLVHKSEIKNFSDQKQTSVEPTTMLYNKEQPTRDDSFTFYFAFYW